MAIYHLSVKTISRSSGRSATAAAAYRAGAKIIDHRTGITHDYRRKNGVESAHIILPKSAPKWAGNRSKLWNAAEESEKRKNSTVAREFEIALPSELSAEEREKLACDFASEIVEKHGCAADVAIHAPGKGDNRNHHAHILLSTRRLNKDGFGEKTRELDDQKSGRAIVTFWRERFAELQNQRLERAGVSVRVDHRTLEAQGIDREPTQHLGPSALGYERRTGKASRKRLRLEIEIADRLQTRKMLNDLQQQEAAADAVIGVLQRQLDDKLKYQELVTAKETGATAFMQKYRMRKIHQDAELERQAREAMIQGAESGRAREQEQFKNQQPQEPQDFDGPSW